jgi:hypothetical protein
MSDSVLCSVRTIIVTDRGIAALPSLAALHILTMRDLPERIPTMPPLTEQVRATVFFPTRVVEPPRVPSWQQLAGSEPEQTLRRPGIHADVGVFSRGRLQLTTALPLRADLVYAPTLRENQQEVASLGVPNDAIAALRDPAVRLITSVGPVVRLAVGVQAIYPTESRDAAYAELPRHLRLHRLNLEGVADFSMQINRPRRSALLDGGPINRVGKWSPAQVMLTALDETGRSARTILHYGLNVETDVSSDAEREQPLPAERLPPLLEELFRFSLEMIESGDAP